MFARTLATRHRLNRLAGCVDIVHRTFASGPIVQAVAMVFESPASDASGRSIGGGLAIVRVMLSSQRVYVMHCSGVVARLWKILPAACAWLQSRSYDEVQFEAYEKQLRAAVDLDHMRVELLRNCTATRAPGISHKKIFLIVLAALNGMRQEWGMEALPALPGTLRSNFGKVLGRETGLSAAFTAGMKADVLEFLRSGILGNASDTLASYNFLIEGHDQSRWYRMQAISLMPELFGLLTGIQVKRSAGSIDRARTADCRTEAAPIVLAIDSGDSLVRALAVQFCVPRETVRWLLRHRLPEQWIVDAGRMRALLTVLSWLAPEKRPRGIAELEAMHGVVQKLLLLFLRLGDLSRSKDACLEPGFGKVVRQWLDELGAPDYAHAGVRLALLTRVHGALENAVDFLGALNSAAPRRPNPEPGGGAPVCFSDEAFIIDWLSRKSLRQVLNCSATWQEKIRAVSCDQEHFSSRTQLTWPCVLPQSFRTGECLVVELCSEQALHYAGVAMRHCVGMFGNMCWCGASLIFSVCRPDGEQLSTIELYLFEYPLRVSLVQHCGYENAAPGPACIDAANALVHFLNQPCQCSVLAARWREKQRQYASFVVRTGSVHQSTVGERNAMATAALEIAVGRNSDN